MADPLKRCQEKNCSNKHYAQDRCKRHYQLAARPGRKHTSPRAYYGRGFSITKNGYRKIRIIGDNGRSRWILEHRHLMEKKLGRQLLPDESVHHKNGVKLDNRLRNLELWLKPQPRGIRVKDAVTWAHEIIERYAA